MKSTILVLDPASSYDLVTLADALLELGLTSPTASEEALVQKHISATSIAIANYCDRVFPAERVEETLWEPRNIPGIGNHYFYTYPYRQHYATSIMLRRYPIVSIDSVYIDGVALMTDSNDASLRIDRDDGILYNLVNGYPSRWYFGQSVVATYTGGYETIPADLQRAALRWTEMAFFASGQDSTIRQEQVYGIASVSYDTSGGSANKMTSGDSVPEEIQLLLEPYMRKGASFA